MNAPLFRAVPKPSNMNATVGVARSRAKRRKGCCALGHWFMRNNAYDSPVACRAKGEKDDELGFVLHQLAKGRWTFFVSTGEDSDERAEFRWSIVFVRELGVSKPFRRIYLNYVTNSGTLANCGSHLSFIEGRNTQRQFPRSHYRERPEQHNNSTYSLRALTLS
jgi:hypothetical protein